MSDASTVFDLHGRLALVTGGASGIGAGIAAMLAAAGAHVVIADRDAVAATRTVAALTQQSHRADAVSLDLADEASIVTACAEVVDRHGTPWLLVHNAGLQDRERLAGTTAAEWDRMMAAIGRENAGTPVPNA